VGSWSVVSVTWDTVYCKKYSVQRGLSTQKNQSTKAEVTQLSMRLRGVVRRDVETGDRTKSDVETGDIELETSSLRDLSSKQCLRCEVWGLSPMVILSG
jgi:hypothetical protein